MKLTVTHFNVRSLDSLDSWVEQQILALGRLRQIDEANVRLARHAGASPAYQVNVHLVTPGPDVFAETRDHTLRAAFTKALAELQDRIAGRATKRVQRVKSNLSAPTRKSRNSRPA
jgi:ribosome-associated translation inhibitor RaiA